jgi:dihydrofolate reductase
MHAASAHLLGRVTYQGFAAAWPTMEGTGEFGEKMNSLRKYVVSSTLADVDASWSDTTVIRGDLVTEVATLKAEPGGDLLVQGSCQLAHALMERGLVDEYRLMIFPIVLGSGKRLFAELHAVSKLTQRRPTGLVLLAYRSA